MKYNNSMRNILIPLLVAAGIIVGLFMGLAIRSTNFQSQIRSIAAPTPRSNDMVSTVMTLIKTQYVDEVNMDSLAKKVIPVIVENLDPHSVFIPAEEFAGVNEPLEGQFDGIGVTFNMLTDTVQVLNVINGGPSFKAGVQNGDRIITINDSIVAGKKINQDDIVKMLKGPRGSEVIIGVKRAGFSELIPITITRGIIPVKSIDSYFMMTPETGYIKLSRFSRNSHTEFVKASRQLKEQGMKNLVFDLRDNVGGYLDQAIMITNEFLPANTMIVYTEGKSRKRMEEFSNGKGTLTDIPLAVLINEGSASASEIVSGAIQDNDRGTIIGRRSFGKALVQEQIPFPDGSALRLTVARYYSPVGRSIQKPYDQGIEAYNNELRARMEHNEYFSADSIRFADSLKFETPGGRIVYGGGGIMPDIFVPADTVGMNRFMSEIIVRGQLIRFSQSYADAHREELNSISDISQLREFMDSHKNMLNEFLAYARKNGVVPRGNELNESRELLEAELKAYVARHSPLEDDGFFLYIQDVDNVIDAVKELFGGN